MLKTHKGTPMHHPKPSKIHGKKTACPLGDTLPFMDSFINKNIAKETSVGHLPNSNLCYRYGVAPQTRQWIILPVNVRGWMAPCALSLRCQLPAPGRRAHSSVAF